METIKSITAMVVGFSTGSQRKTGPYRPGFYYFTEETADQDTFRSYSAPVFYPFSFLCWNDGGWRPRESGFQRFDGGNVDGDAKGAKHETKYETIC